MTSPASVPKVEDLVKAALTEALSKRKLAKEGVEPSELLIETLGKTEKPVAEDKPVKEVVLKEHQKMFSDVIGNKVDADEDFAVSCFFDEAWDEKIIGFIPEVDPEYVLDVARSKAILLAWELNEKVLCFGPTGSGKSSLIEQLCARTNRPFVRVNCSGDMDSSMMFGQLIAKDGSTLWQDGSITEAVKYGAVFAWDEWDVTPPEISMGMQWLLEDNGKLFLKEMPGASNDKMIIPHEHFRLVALGNTQGQGDDTGAHSGTNVQNSATLDRFGTAVYIDYLPAAVEEKMILNKYADIFSTKLVKEFVKLANLIRQGYKAGQLSLTMSPRSLFSVCKKCSVGVSLNAAFASVYTNKLNDTQRKVASELFTKIFGERTIKL
jgi:cobaltochelatase CobS